MFDEYLNGTCKYVIVYRVTTQTSGNELPGPSVHWGDFPSEPAASIALANAPEKFTRKEFGWQGNSGYTTAHISRTVLYDFPNEITIMRTD